MFYVRINQIKVFNNREGFLGLFNRAELRIYSHAIGYTLGFDPGVPSVPPLTLAELIVRQHREYSTGLHAVWL
jgi:hypothetical protein